MSTDFKLAGIFTDNMMLQRNVEIPVWGSAEDGERIEVEFCGKTKSNEAVNGSWKVTLPPADAGGPFEMKIKGASGAIVLKNILVGEVWIAGGQSNMEYVLVNSRDGKNEIPAADYPDIRYYHVARIPYESASSDESETQSGWKVCTPENAGAFSAVAYHFAKDLHKAIGVPVGIINCNWGGTSASCWMSENYLSEDADTRVYLDEYRALAGRQDNESYEKARKKYDKEVEAYNKRAANLSFDPDNVDDYFSDSGLGAFPWPPPMGPKCHLRPAGLYYTMLKKIVPYAVKGVIWYQGESDVEKGRIYSKLFGKMIQNWREVWGNLELPFLFVQLPAYGEGEDWAILREQQLIASNTISNTAMIVTIDCGDKNNIHPTNKKPVGERLALLARARIYGQNNEYSGPVYREMKLEGSRIILYFEHAGKGLAAKGGALQGFKISGENRQFVDAKAEINGNAVAVYSGEVSAPVAVRYGWANYVEVNLYNDHGLPAGPFRTDSW